MKTRSIRRSVMASLIAAAVITPIAGCVAEGDEVADPEEVESPATVTGDDVRVIPASAATTQTYGIVKWSLTIQPDRDRHLIGIKANGHAAYDTWSWTSANGNWQYYDSGDVQFSARVDGSEYYLAPEEQPWKLDADAAFLAAYGSDYEAWSQAHPVPYSCSGAKWRMFFWGAAYLASSGGLLACETGVACAGALSGMAASLANFTSASDDRAMQCP